MSTRSLALFLPAVLAAVALASVLAVDFVRYRTAAPGAETPNVASYLGSLGGRRGAGGVPDPVELAAAEPRAGAQRDDPRGPWFRRAQSDTVPEDRPRLVFTCERGEGDAKVCRATPD